MNKKISFIAMALLCNAALIVGCGDDDPQPNEPVPVEPTGTHLAGIYGGWTLGSNEYASYIPSEGDTLTISLTNAEGTSCDLTYVSPTWGTTTLKGVSVITNDTAFLLSKPITATIRPDHSAWDFSAAVDSIAMPNRNPQSETVTVKNYPIVLTSGTVSLDAKTWEINFTTYLVPRSEHIQWMSFRNGKPQKP